MSARWHVGCDHCGAGAWIGPGPEDRGAWCEACQAGVVLPRDAAPGRARCQRCGGPLATESLRSEELWGEIQHLAAVLDAWRGDPGPLASLLPVRPRFITDLTPPEPAEEDDHATRAALATLARGAFGDARARLEEAVEDGRGGARLWQALAVAYERLAQPSLAEWAWSQVLERGESQTARLARGVLEARRGDFEGARDDHERAGDGFEARGDRAALMVLEAVAGTPGLPDPGVLPRARAAAGEIAPYWSNPTVGRLLWSLLIERAGARAARGDAARAACADERVLRAAEREIEFHTFWDRALVVHGYAALGMTSDAARAGAALALELAAALAGEPCLRGVAARPIAAALEAALAAVRAGDPAAARSALEPLLQRQDLARYRMPCGHCGAGSIGIDKVEDEPEPAPAPALQHPKATP